MTTDLQPGDRVRVAEVWATKPVRPAGVLKRVFTSAQGGLWAAVRFDGHDDDWYGMVRELEKPEITEGCCAGRELPVTGNLRLHNYDDAVSNGNRAALDDAYRRTKGPVAFLDESYQAPDAVPERRETFYIFTAVLVDLEDMDELRTELRISPEIRAGTPPIL